MRYFPQLNDIRPDNPIRPRRKRLQIDAQPHRCLQPFIKALLTALKKAFFDRLYLSPVERYSLKGMAIDADLRKRNLIKSNPSNETS